MTVGDLIDKLSNIDPATVVLTIDGELGTDDEVNMYYDPACADYPLDHTQPAVIITRWGYDNDRMVEL